MTERGEKMEQFDYEKAIATEVKRLNELFKSIPPNKKKLVEGLIVQAARLRASIDYLWLDIQENGEYEDFQNGKEAGFITRERAASKTFTARDKSYQAIIKQLADYVPPEASASKLDALLKEVE